MPRTNEPKVIRHEIVTAYSQCPRKAFLLHCTAERGAPKEYERLLEERSRANRISYLAKLQQTKTAICSYKNGALSSGVDALTEADFETANVEAHCDVLVRADQCKHPHVYEPTIVAGTYRVEEEQTLKLAVAGYVLEHLQGTSPAVGYVVTFDGECHRINLRPLFKTVGSILEHIKEWSAQHPTQPPPVILNKHCPYCPFESVCRQQAEATDDLSLLDRMTPKAIRRYHDKGIFTVKQLSFLFKPRRRGRRARIQPPHFNLEIQALAIRTGKIYIERVPEIHRCDTELFLDIEGVPDQQFCYLIGLLVRDRQTITHHAFWSDAMVDEESMWTMFVKKAKEYPDAPIYHYGSYEARVIGSLAKRFGADMTCIAKRLVNLNSQVYGKIYFPIRSNSLKVLGKFLGASWTAPDASGLQSLVWRYRWEMSGDPAYKQQLISYNAEDCRALHILTEELTRLRTNADSESNVDYVDHPKQNATSVGTELHTALDHCTSLRQL